jgi:type IV pilus assembly protein PilC
MPLFSFRYVDSSGTNHSGQAEADDHDTLARELRGKGAVLEIKEVVRKDEGPREVGEVKFSLQRSLSKDEVALFCRQLGTMLTAGLPLMKVLAILRKRCTNGRLAKILDELAQSIQEGGRFSESLAKYPDVFDPLFVNLIKVGEASGKLAPMVEELANLLDKDAALQRRVRSAMSYPGFILMFMGLLSYVIGAFLMPLFIPVFSSAGLNIKRDYPLTQLLMDITKFVNDPLHVALMVAALIGLAVGWKGVSIQPAFRKARDRFLFGIPLFNSLFRYSAVSRFARTLATLMGSGMPMLQSLRLVAGASGNVVISDSVERIANQLSKGKKVSESMDLESKVFPDLLIQMTQVGEEAAALPQMLTRAAEYYEQQLDAAITRLMAMLEPGMMVVVGGIVCGFVMAVLLPILGLAQMK